MKNHLNNLIHHKNIISILIILLITDIGLDYPFNPYCFLAPLTKSEFNFLLNHLSNHEDSQVDSKTNQISQKYIYLFFILYKEKEFLINELKLPSLICDKIINLLSEQRIIRFLDEYKKMKNKGVDFITLADDDYPLKIKTKLQNQSYLPLFFFYSGELSLITKTAVSIVGSRYPSTDAAVFTQLLAFKNATENGFVTVSGNAIGVDTIAQKTALNNKGAIISFLPYGINLFVDNKKNALIYKEAIKEKNALFLSFCCPNEEFKGFNALNRNDCIYAQGDFSVVVSAEYKKGGSWSGASRCLANNYSYLFVRSKSENGETDNFQLPDGNIELLKKGSVFPISIENLKNSPLDEFFNRSIETQKSAEQLYF